MSRWAHKAPSRRLRWSPVSASGPRRELRPRGPQPGPSCWWSLGSCSCGCLGRQAPGRASRSQWWSCGLGRLRGGRALWGLLRLLRLRLRLRRRPSLWSDHYYVGGVCSSASLPVVSRGVISASRVSGGGRGGGSRGGGVGVSVGPSVGGILCSEVIQERVQCLLGWIFISHFGVLE